SQVIPVYQQASAATGVPWEIFAAIHYIETNGGDFNPNQSLISGRPLGTPEPDQGGQVYTSLYETALVAANVFKSAYGSQSGPYTDFRRLVTAFAGYNGTGNRQCFENGTPKPQTEYTGCPALFLNEDHLYPLACYDTRHENMWLVYCGDHQLCPEVSATYHGHKFSPGRVGALALIAGIQARNQPTATPPTAASPTPPAESLRHFNQCDQAFQDASFGSCTKDGQLVPLLCAAGCVPTSMSQVIASYADSSYTPVDAARALRNGSHLSCDGSDMIYQNQLLNTYSSSIEKGPITDSNGALAVDASRLKPFFDEGWTALARIGYTRERYGSTVRGHYIWITRIDSNNDVWAYDPYFVNTEVMGQNAQAPINMNGLVRREYSGSDFTSIDITKFMLVRKK
nr:C39 family peptidase [Candidatus Woesebacteria bacterium]